MRLADGIASEDCVNEGFAGIWGVTTLKPGACGAVKDPRRTWAVAGDGTITQTANADAMSLITPRSYLTTLLPIWDEGPDAKEAKALELSGRCQASHFPTFSTDGTLPGTSEYYQQWWTGMTASGNTSA